MKELNNKRGAVLIGGVCPRTCAASGQVPTDRRAPKVEWEGLLYMIMLFQAFTQNPISAATDVLPKHLIWPKASQSGTSLPIEPRLKTHNVSTSTYLQQLFKKPDCWYAYAHLYCMKSNQSRRSVDQDLLSYLVCSSFRGRKRSSFASSCTNTLCQSRNYKTH